MNAGWGIWTDDTSYTQLAFSSSSGLDHS